MFACIHHQSFYSCADYYVFLFDRKGNGKDVKRIFGLLVCAFFLRVKKGNGSLCHSAHKLSKLNSTEKNKFKNDMTWFSGQEKVIYVLICMRQNMLKVFECYKMYANKVTQTFGALPYP